MPLNLYVLPLSTIENFTSQKCLLPQHLFPQIGQPGQYAKCYFRPIGQIEESTNFAICQIFPRDENSVCYLDTSVCKYKLTFNEDEQLLLESVELLDHNEVELADVHISFRLNANYCIQHIDALSQSFLYEMARIMLQGYHFSTQCSVRGLEIQSKGVDEILIKISSLEDKLSFIITEDTNVHIENVSLTTNAVRNAYITFDIPAFKSVRQQLDDLLEAGKMQRSNKAPLRMSLNALLVGAVGSGKTVLIEEFLRHHQCNVFRVTTTNVLNQYPGETETQLRKIFKTAMHFERHFQSKESIVILLEDIQLLCPSIKGSNNNSEASTNSMRIVSQLLLLIDELFISKSNIVCLATTSNADSFNEMARRPGRFEKEVNIPMLTLADRTVILQKLFVQTLPNRIVPPQNIIQLIAKQTQGYAIADLALLVHNISQGVITHTQTNFDTIVRENLRKSQPMSIRETDVIAYKTTESFDVIGGMERLKKMFEVTVLSGLKRESSFRRFGLSLPKGILLYGPPGCAKTTIAKCLATEANMTFIATSGAEVYSPYIGCAEKFISKIFDTARKNSPCLVFLDEIDSLVGRRTLNSSSGDVQIRILSTLLTEMDGIVAGSATSSADLCHVLVVAATNRPDMVDDALMRPGRLDKLIHIPAPDLASRHSILHLYQQKMPFDKGVNLKKIAEVTDNYSGADICNLCNEAGMRAFQRDFNAATIQQEDFDYVLKKLSKSSLTSDQIDWYYKFENRFLKL